VSLTGAAAVQQRRPHGAQALSAVLGGTNSLHTNSLDEALALPTAEGCDARAPHAADHRA
jgi:methylmalonyl-CoA mutase N-terminal domain/subunit